MRRVTSKFLKSYFEKTFIGPAKKSASLATPSRSEFDDLENEVARLGRQAQEQKTQNRAQDAKNRPSDDS